MLWQMGHVILFYVKHVFINLNIRNLSNLHNFIDFYDSYKTDLKYRNNNKKLMKKATCINYYIDTIQVLINYVKMNKITHCNSYLIMLGILHNEMHNEAFLFTRYNINNKLLVALKEEKNYTLINTIEYIEYPKGIFYQGTNDQKEYLSFDNEMPRFKKKLDKFSISKYCITEYQFLQFIIDDGYNDKIYWSDRGYKWKTENNIEMPLYWINHNNIYYKMLNEKATSVETNLPIIHISYYEAEAFCSWKGCRLPTESEYEYVSTNMGKTKNPWGNKNIDGSLANINYTKYILPVDDYKIGDNKKGVRQLMGNVWEWCKEPIYPYDNFKIDPVYREMSYPYFGFKMICKGGAFSVPDFLIHPRYRNAQLPECRIQFIGFRVCI